MYFKTFCLECHRYISDSEIGVVGKSVHHKINIEKKHKKFEFDYIEKEAVCKNCGKPVYIPEINDENVDSYMAAYNKEINKDG